MADVRLTATNPEDSSVVPVACDASGRLLLQELPAVDTIDGDLTVTGKGTFAGGKSIIGNDGSAQFAQGAVDIYANGTVEFTQDVTFGGSATFVGQINGNSGAVISGGALAIDRAAAGNTALSITYGGSAVTGATIDANGSATFAGTGTFDVAGNTSGLIIKQRGVASDYINLYVAAGGGGQVFVKDSTGKTNIQLLGNNGSATFAGAVDIGPFISGVSGVRITNAGTVYNVGQGDNAAYWTGDDLNKGPNCVINYDGSVAFAGNKAGFTAEGYLWCTTRRGDTVILDATSNGLASWAEYTPTTRIDDIRDELNAIRGDAAEMPADTP